MRHFLVSAMIVAIWAAPVFAQTVEMKIVKLADRGEIHVSHEITQVVSETVFEAVPVTEQVVQDGRIVTVTKLVQVEKTIARTISTTGFMPLAEKNAKFTDLAGKPLPLDEVKKRIEKGARGVISLPEAAPLPADAILQTFRNDTMILRQPNPAPTSSAPAAPAKRD